MPARGKYPEHIEKAMSDKDIGVYELASRCKLSPPTVRKILRGESSSSDVFREAAEKRITQVLGISKI